MRTGEEILFPYHSHVFDELEMIFTLENAIKAINEARKEAIEECAGRAIAKADWYRGRFTGDAYVEKNSILSLINELK